VSFSPDGRLLASAGRDETLRFWEANGQPRGEPLRGQLGWVNHVSFSPDGHLLASASEDGTIRFWDVASGQPRGEPLRGHTEGVRHVSFSPDGRLLASAGNDNTIHLWELASELKIDQRNLTREEWRKFMGEAPYQKIFEDLP
jgi:WD40 repeat protein